MEPTEFKYRTVRCEWQIAIVDTDQYGHKENTVAILEAFPTYDLAAANRPKYGVRHQYVQDRWIPHNPTHAYQTLEIRYREVEI